MNSIFKRKKINLLSLIVLIFISCNSEESNQETVFFGDVELRTQEEINDFGSNNYVRIAGSLTIDTNIQNTDNVTDLSPLNSIEIVDSSLSIFRLSNISEIRLNFKEVGGLVIMLETVESINFPSLIKTTLDFINIQNCPELWTINFPSLLSIKAELYILNNSKLENLDGFSSLTSIGFGSDTQNRIRIQSNDLLSSLNGLINVNSQIDLLNIETNNSLETLDGLDNLLLKDIEILLNSNLRNYCSISNFISDGITYNGENYEDGTNLTILDNLYNPVLQNFIDAECSN